MNLNNFKKLFINGTELKQLFINGVQVWKSGYKNWVRYSTESDGVTIYNGGLGYKNGYRIRSGGAEGSANAASCTGFIRAVGGNVVRLSGYNVKYANNENAINVYNASYTNLGQVSANYYYGIFADGSQRWEDVILEKEGVYYWVVPEGFNIAYIRVSGYTSGDGSKMIVTVNEEIA